MNPVKTLAYAMLASALALTATPASHAQFRAEKTGGYSTTTYGPSKYYQAAPYGRTVSFSESYTVQNTFSANGGITKYILSASVNFQVDQTHNFSYSTTFNMQPGRTLTIRPIYGWEISYWNVYLFNKKLGSATTKKLVYNDLQAR